MDELCDCGDDAFNFHRGIVIWARINSCSISHKGSDDGSN